MRDIEELRSIAVSMGKPLEKLLYEMLFDAMNDNDRLNNIINNLEKWLNNQINDIKNNYSQVDGNYFNMNYVIDTYEEILNKLKELKGDSNA